MKTNNILFLSGIILCTILTGCSKGSDNPESNKPLKQYPAPNWHVDDASSLAYSMTAVIAISDSLKQTVSNGDEFAAFIGDKCRGVGVYIERDSAAPVFYVLIKGAADETGALSFKYYNKQSRYMYSAGSILDFEIDDNYGTVDIPALPDFLQL